MSADSRPKGIDPSLEASGLTGHDLGAAQRARQHRTALIGRDELDRKVTGIVEPGGTELLLGPAERDLQQHPRVGIPAVGPFGQL